MKQKNHEWNVKTKEAHEVHPVNSFEFFSHNKDVKPHSLTMPVSSMLRVEW